ncbi:MAG: DUF374 domain-containing protein [Deltaproteobacteria bacterium]|nr:DUF374 domain-containing protein [Deltaproteobacteria bacterium]
MKKILNKITIAIAPFLISVLIKFLAMTMRISYVNFAKDWRSGRNVILAFWHGRLLMMPVMCCGVTVLVSQHKDGELIARAVKRFNIDSVRGSSTRGWLGGVRGLLNAVKRGKDIAITPDGPKGPKFNVQTGIIHLAKLTGLPIIPMTFSASKKKLLKAGMVLSCLIHFPKAYLYAAPPSL